MADNLIIMFPSNVVISISSEFPYINILTRYANFVVKAECIDIIRCRWIVNSLSDFGYDLVAEMHYVEFDKRIQDIALGYDFKQKKRRTK